MTYKEIADKYIDLFVLVMETAGDVTNNKSYKNIENTLKEKQETINKAIEDEVDFDIFIVILITELLLDIHDLEDLAEKSEEEMYELIKDMWERYLKKPTRSFTTQYGLKKIDEINYSVFIRKKEIR